MNLEMKNHIAYFFFIAICAVTGLLILSYCSGIMLAFLYGIITIPFAIVLGTIPFIALTLVLSTPFYAAISWKLPGRQLVGMFGGIGLALLLSAGLAWAGRAHLLQAGNELIAADVAGRVDFVGKHVLVTNARHKNRCSWPCVELLHLGAAKSVSISQGVLGDDGALPAADITFELASFNDKQCVANDSSSFAHAAMKDDHSKQYQCIRKRTTPLSEHQIALERTREFARAERESYNPFADAIEVEQLRIEEISAGGLTTKFRHTSVNLFLPFWVLWPVSIDGSEHTASIKGLLRAEHSLKEPLEMHEAVFGLLKGTLN